MVNKWNFSIGSNNTQTIGKTPKKVNKDGNGNVQQSDDENTVQIQIGPEVITRLLTILGLVVGFLIPIVLYWLL